MSERNKLELSRRKVLGGLGTIGIASAGAGLGTSAYFSDEETFKNNTLTAGSLDLKVDWEEHYYDGMNDAMSSEADVSGVRMVDSAGDVQSDEIGMPDPENPLLAVKRDQLEAFQNASAIEAFPDETGDDGIQDPNPYALEYAACENLADAPDDMDPTNGARTENADTMGPDGPKPLVSLEDVKPGDFGELTLSFHLCDNPGYVWMNGHLVSESENGVTEPESKDPDEGPGVELTDKIQTLLWYDEDGDNVYEPGGEAGEVDVMIVFDHSGSMDGTRINNAKSAAVNLVNSLNLGPNAGNVGLVGFDQSVGPTVSLTDDASTVNSAINNLTANGTTNIEGAVDEAQSELTAGRSGAQKIMIVLSDGAPNVNGDGNDEPGADYDGDGDTEFADVDPNDNATDAKNAGTRIFTVGYGISAGSETAGLLQQMASSPSDAYLANTSDIQQVLSNISQSIAGEKCFFRGSLRELLGELSSGQGIPLDGDRQTGFDEVVGVGNDDQYPNGDAAASRDCFVPSTTNAVGLAWWLPVNHGNEVQSDSVAFDLGFYTEQCRHNTGSGMDPLIPTRTGSGFAKVSENFNGDGSKSAGARARFGGTNTWELGVGDDFQSTGQFSSGEYSWSSGTQVDWSVAYDESTDEMTFTFDGNAVTHTITDPQPDGRIAVQAKAENGATVDISNVTTDIGPLSGSTSTSASGSNSGREISYVVLNTDLDGETSFSVSGQATVTIDSGTYGGSEEGANLDIVFE